MLAEADDAAASPGGHLRGQRSDQEVRRPDVGGEEPVEGRHIEFGRRPEPGEPGVVDQDVNRAGLLGQVVQLGGVAEVGGHEAGLPARRGDHVDYRGTARGVPSVHDHLGAVPGQALGHRPAYT